MHINPRRSTVKNRGIPHMRRNQCDLCWGFRKEIRLPRKFRSDILSVPKKLLRIDQRERIQLRLRIVCIRSLHTRIFCWYCCYSHCNKYTFLHDFLFLVALTDLTAAIRTASLVVLFWPFWNFLVSLAVSWLNKNLKPKPRSRWSCIRIIQHRYINLCQDLTVLWVSLPHFKADIKR